jgi:hypothetical protein
LRWEPYDSTTRTWRRMRCTAVPDADFNSLQPRKHYVRQRRQDGYAGLLAPGRAAVPKSLATDAGDSGNAGLPGRSPESPDKSPNSSNLPGTPTIPGVSQFDFHRDKRGQSPLPHSGPKGAFAQWGLRIIWKAPSEEL